ncbi:MAG: presenilin family intramembrane aspartyl protease [Candidatus Hydrothermarchaeota archaeon]
MLILVFISICTQILGLWITLKPAGYNVPLTSNPESLVASTTILIYFILATIILYVFLKYVKEPFFMRIIEAISILITSSVTFYFMEIPWQLSFLLVLARLFSQSIWILNFSMIFCVAGAGAILGKSLGVIPCLTLLLIVMVYDYISVKKTGHMVEMAERLTSIGNMFMFVVPKEKGEHVHLGAGDVGLPLAFIISSSSISILVSLITLVACNIGLLFIIYKVDERPIPALPILGLAIVIGFLIGITIEDFLWMRIF